MLPPTIRSPYPSPRKLCGRSAALLGLPGRIEATRKFKTPGHKRLFGMCSYGWLLFDGAAEDGRAPTEELSCVRGSGLLSDGGGRGRPRSDRRAFVCEGWGFCPRGAAEDGRAPTEELSCVRGLGF